MFARQLVAALPLGLALAAFACGSDGEAPAVTDEGGRAPAADGGVATDGDVVVDGGPKRVSGLTTRAANPTCRAFTAAPPTGKVRLVDRFPNVPLTLPTGLFQRPGDNERWYVTERAGRIVHFPNRPGVTAADVKVALDLTGVVLTDNDCALAGIAFPPDFATSKRAYVNYCYRGPESGNKLQLRVSRFATNDGGATFDRASEQLVVALDHPTVYPGADPALWAGLHGADAIRFGKDGYLYVAYGDGGPHGKFGGTNSQDKNDLRGKLLRIDVKDLTKSLSKDFVGGRQRVAADYPADNPFAAGGGHAAIYAYGFRNPWQWNFDRKNGSIWVGDVGYADYEEVDRDVKKGGNYGWSGYEGFHCTGDFPEICTDASVNMPLLDYAHGDGPQFGNAVTGGIVYRGIGVPSLTGAYVFGDSADGRIWQVKNVDAIAAGTVPAKEPLFDGTHVTAFAEDQDAELYALIGIPTTQYPKGLILAFEEVPSGGPVTGGPPALLSQTGCFDAADPKTPVAALVPYAPSAELWSDGASKRRWLALPDGKTLTVGSDGDFDFPAGTVLVKEFTVAGQRVETRFFVRQEADGNWAGYTYQWKADQTDATLVAAAGSKVTVDAQTWNIPSRAQCGQCHTKVAGTTLGLELAQLNHDLMYPSTGITGNQLFTLETIGMMAHVDAPPALAAIGDTTKSAEQRARAYIHANCANCHRPDGPTFTPLDLRWSTPLAGMGICNAQPTIDALEEFIPSEPRLFAPGDPERSVLYWRLATTDQGVRMPPVGRSVAHDAGVAAVKEWIKTTTACP